MLDVLYLVAIILGVSGQSILKKPYTQKVGGSGVYVFGTLTGLGALLFFVLTSSDLQFSTSFLPYSVGFAVSYAVSVAFAVLAIAHGSLSLTSLFVSYSLMIPTAYGLLFWGDPVRVGSIVGLGLLMISLFLVNKTEKGARFSFKWVLFVLLAFAGNGMCTVVQKLQQNASGGAYKNEFMIVALALVTVFMLVMALLRNRRDLKLCVTSGWHLALVCGLLNGMVNLFVMILSHRMVASLMFPLISAGGLIITYLVSRFVYKEQLTTRQTVGFVFGLAAIVFLNL